MPLRRLPARTVGRTLRYANTIVTGDGQSVPLSTIPVYNSNASAAVPPGIDGRCQTAVDRIKKAANYTPLVIGKLLQTENAGQPLDPATVVGLIRSFHSIRKGSRSSRPASWAGTSTASTSTCSAARSRR